MAQVFHFISDPHQLLFPLLPPRDLRTGLLLANAICQSHGRHLADLASCVSELFYPSDQHDTWGDAGGLLRDHHTRQLAEEASLSAPDGSDFVMEPDEYAELWRTLSPWTLRFQDAAAEAAYLHWRSEKYIAADSLVLGAATVAFAALQACTPGWRLYPAGSQRFAFDVVMPSAILMVFLAVTLMPWTADFFSGRRDAIMACLFALIVWQQATSLSGLGTWERTFAPLRCLAFRPLALAIAGLGVAMRVPVVLMGAALGLEAAAVATLGLMSTDGHANGSSAAGLAALLGVSVIARYCIERHCRRAFCNVPFTI